MDSHSKMDVVDWRDLPLPGIPKTRGPRRFQPSTFIGILGTLLLHAIVIQSLPFGPKAKSPETQKSAGARLTSKVERAGSLILITLPTTANSSETATQGVVLSLPDLGKMRIKSPVTVDQPAFLNLETLALSEDQAAKSTVAAGDGAEQARLFGIYTGQIQARIDRVWQRPRTPINEDNSAAAIADAGDTFQCQAQIVQDAIGNVQEILLPRCNGTAAWQRSLVLAIQQASPLPAPPSASVFRHSITLSFVGLAYVAGSSDDGYEIEPTRVARE